STASAQRDPWPEHRSTKRRDPRAARTNLRAAGEGARVKEAAWRSNSAARIGFFAAGVLAVLTVAALFVPRAAIKLTPISQEQRVTIPVTAGESIKSISITGNVPAHEIKFTVTGTQSATIISQASVPQDKAKGVARFKSLTQVPVTIPAETVVYSAGPMTVRFVTLNETHLEGKVNSVVEVPIVAVEAGETGNLPANSITAVEGSLGISVSVTNPEPTSGGTNRTAVAPSEDDRKRVHDVLMSLLPAQAQKQAAGLIGANDILLVNTLKMGQVLEETYDPPAGEPGNLLKLTMRVEFSAQYMQADDLNQLAETTLNASIPDGFLASPDTLKFTMLGTPVLDESGASHFDLQVERGVKHEVNAQRANALVRGLSRRDAARVLLHELPLEKSPEIDLSPSWWPWMPLIPFRITFQ
ncbi:MAG: baseplate J/gp47 family protein, partial [Chloroflexi bacterium]|nr:baseplate J/gp47 family protein [Chloroflexota bacterium]